jgi:ankyrin repeat protein
MRMTRLAVAVSAALLGAVAAPALLAQVKGAEVTKEEATTSTHPVMSLVEAARAGDSLVALELLKHHADVNAAESDGTTPLHWAVYKNDVPLVQALIKAGADVNVMNDFGSSPLSEAAVTGNVAVMDALLKAGADPESPNADGQTALMVLARTSNVEAAKLLLKKGANVNAVEKWHGQTALMWAAAQEQPEMVKLLVKHGANVNARSLVNGWQRQVTAEPRAQARPSGGLTPLLYAARQGCLGCVQALVEAKADVDLTDPDGVTPLIVAVDNFHFDVGAYLLKHGANPNKWDWWGRTPLYLAVDLNTVPHGGRPDRISLDETTSLKMIELLLDAGANPNAQLKLFPPYRALGPDRGADLMLTMGATPLLRAAKAGDVPAIKLLLAHGAKPNLPNIYGTTPVMAAAGLSSTEIDTRGRFKTQEEAVESINLLVAAGGDVNAHETRVCPPRGFFCVSGQTALHGAALWGWNDVIKALVAHKADINATDAKGNTPLDSALGKAGGHGRGGTRIEVHEQTAALIRELAAASPQPTKAQL